jgi:hypothetical protein
MLDTKYIAWGIAILALGLFAYRVYEYLNVKTTVIKPAVVYPNNLNNAEKPIKELKDVYHGAAKGMIKDAYIDKKVYGNAIGKFENDLTEQKITN